MTDDNLDPARFGEAYLEFLRVVTANAPKRGPILRDRIQAHLETNSNTLPVFTETFDPHDHPNVQVALDAWVREGDNRETTPIGVSTQHKGHLDSLLSTAMGVDDSAGFGPLWEGAVDYVNFRLADDQVLSCIQFGVLLLRDGADRLAVSVLGPSGHQREKLQVEVVSLDPAIGQASIAELRALMSRLNVYRGHVISLSPGRMHMGPQTLVAFHHLPTIRREDVVLPEAVLERIERHTFVFSEHADRLLAAGRSLKRGMLLYGAPGIGKTLTLMYLIGRMPGRTVLLTTGLGVGLLQPVMQMARELAPAMVVLEDVDLIAEERGMAHSHSTGGLLFELLNELDGLQDDADVIFALTTNRPEILEPALAARPGRVDLAIELPLPDEASRRRLFDLYARGLTLREVDAGAFAGRTEGASPAYIKELIRRASVLAALEDVGEGHDLVVGDAHLEQAIEELAEGGRLAGRILGFHQGGEEDPVRSMETGFPPPSRRP